MVSEQPNEANDNFFTHFSYEAWAPGELQKLYPKVVEIESVLERLEDEPTLESLLHVILGARRNYADRYPS